jgi:putative transposase
MTYDARLHHRRSIRLKDYDYAQQGAYYLTICIHERRFCLGEVEAGQVRLSDAGQMVNSWWVELAEKFKGIELDYYVVMPNHIHGIVVIGGDGVGADLGVRPREEWQIKRGQTQRSAPTLGEMVQWFKTMSTNDYIRNVKTGSFPRFNKYFWQRNYYEHVIRNDEDLNRAREYIQLNPLKWEEDDLNPQRNF